jgi:hypothetical protein
MSEEKNTPLTFLVFDFLRTLPLTKEALAALDPAEASILDEFDVFVRANNRTNYRIDGLAAASARMERLIDGRDGWALTYSTMKGRRVDDVLYCLLDHASSFVFPATEREDKGKDGKPKMQSHRADRDRWIASLGYTKAEIGKGKRNLFGDTFQELKDELEAMIPERFEGTEQPQTAKQLLALIAPAALGAEVIRINVYKANHEGNTNSLISLMRFLLAGYRFQTKPDSGEVIGELAQFYAGLAEKKLAEIKHEQALAAEKALAEAQLKEIKEQQEAVA